MPTRSGALKRTPPPVAPVATRSQSTPVLRETLPDPRLSQTVEVLEAENPENNPGDDTVSYAAEPAYGAEAYDNQVRDWREKRRTDPIFESGGRALYQDSPVAPRATSPTPRAENVVSASTLATILEKISKNQDTMMKNQKDIETRMRNVEISRQVSRAASRAGSHQSISATALGQALGRISEANSNQEHGPTVTIQTDIHPRSSHSSREFDRNRTAPLEDSNTRFIRSQKEQLKNQNEYIEKQSSNMKAMSETIRELKSYIVNGRSGPLPAGILSVQGSDIPNTTNVNNKNNGNGDGHRGSGRDTGGGGGVIPPPRIPPPATPFGADRNRNYYLKSEEIGSWDPKDSSTPISVWCRRLRQLADKHGEDAVLRNVDKALSKVNTWLSSLSDADIEKQNSIDGWIELLIRDFGVSKGQALRDMHSFDWTQADSALEFCNQKLALLREAGVTSEELQTTEIIASLPLRWREHLSTNQYDVTSLRRSIRDLETAAGRWPTQRESSSKNRDSTKANRGTKRGGGFESPSFRKKGRSEDSPKSKDKKKPPYPCSPCVKTGKSDEEAMHWMDDCPMKAAITNKKVQRKSVNFNNTDDNVDKSESSSESEDDDHYSSDSETISFVSVCAASVMSRIPKSNSYTIVDSIPESQPWKKEGHRFENQSPVIILALGSAKGETFPVIADTGCPPSMIGRDTFKKIWPDVPIMKMEGPGNSLRVKLGYNGTETELVNDFATPPLFLPTDDGQLVKIHVEFHITDKTIDKPGILLGGADMKYNNIDVSYNDECLKISPLQSLETYRIPMSTAKPGKKIPKISSHVVRCSSKVEIPAKSTGYVPIDISELASAGGPFLLTPKGKRHQQDNGFCSSPFAIVSDTTSMVEYSNFSSDDVFVQPGQVIGHVDHLDQDDVYSTALTHEEQIKGVKLNEMMSKIPADYMETDEIEVGISREDLGIHNVSTDKIPPGF